MFAHASATSAPASRKTALPAWFSTNDRTGPLTLRAHALCSTKVGRAVSAIARYRRSEGKRRVVDPDDPHAAEEVEQRRRVVPADAGAAEERLRRRRAHGEQGGAVDLDLAAAQARPERDRGRLVAAEHVPGEAVGAEVRTPQRLVVVTYRVDGHDGAEDLLERGVRREADHQRRHLPEPVRREVAGLDAPPAAGVERG